ncbi:MAG: MG2 domain-containing protein [Candidatus Krumholzibacteria bacterium]|nr:MG2 domain-containing protein [Candidatus Krumholzibacteria bacterium]
MALILLLSSFPASAFKLPGRTQLDLSVKEDATKIQSTEWQVHLEFAHEVYLGSLDRKLKVFANGIEIRHRIESLDKTPHRGKRFLLGPKEPLDCYARVKIRIDKGLKSTRKRHQLQEAFEYSFGSSPDFLLTNLEWQEVESRLKITFSNPVDKNRTLSALRLSPRTSIYRWNSEVTGNSILVEGEFRHGQDYSLGFRNLRDQNQVPLQDKDRFTFRVPDMTGKLEFDNQDLLLERDSRQLLHLNALNVETVQLRTLSLPALLAPFVNLHRDSLEQLPMEQIRAILQEEAGRMLLPESFLIEAMELSASGGVFSGEQQRNVRHRLTLPLSFRENAEKGGLLLLRASDAKEDTVRSRLALLSVSDLSLSVRRSDQDLLVWVNSLSTGMPVEGVSLFATTDSTRIHLLGKTDHKGALLLSRGRSLLCWDRERNRRESQALEPEKLKSLLALGKSDACLLELDKTSRIRSDLGKGGSFKDKRGRLVCERGIYQPGEMVYFKGFLRQWKAGEILPPESDSCLVRIRDSRQRIVSTKSLRVSDFGTVHDSFALPAHSRMGLYQVELHQGKRQLASCNFQVEEFRPPRHRVRILFDRDQRESTGYVNRRHLEEALLCTIESDYLAGGPVKNAKVRWKVMATDGQQSVAGHPDFEFRNELAGERDLLESGESVLDARGRFQFHVPLSREILNSQHGLEISASVVDFDGRVSRNSSVYQEPAQLLLGIRKGARTRVAGDRSVLEVMALDADGQPLDSGEIEVRVLRQNWNYLRKRNRSGEVYWSWDRYWEESGFRTLPLENGRANWEQEFRDGGDTLIRVSCRTQDGREIQASALFKVEGYRRPDAQDPEKAYQKLHLLTDRNQYQTGDTLHLKIRGEEKLQSILLSVEGEELREVHVLEGNEVAIPIREEHAPNFYLRASAVHGRGQFPLYSGSIDEESPRLSFGECMVRVQARHETPTLTIGQGHGPLRAKPGENLQLKLLADRDMEVLLAVVDERVLALTRFATPSLASLLDFQLPLNVEVYEQNLALMRQSFARVLGAKEMTGGDGGSATGAGKSLSEATLRKDFRPVAAYHPALRVAKGEACVVDIPLPDDLTSYRIYALACDRSDGLLSVERELRVEKKFRLEAGLPRFLCRGDRIHFPVAGISLAPGTSPIEVLVEETGDLRFANTAAKKNCEGQSALLYFDAEAPKVGTSQVDFAARRGEQGDRVREEIPVHSPSVLERHFFHGVFRDSLTRKLSLDPELKVPENADPGEWNARLTLSASPFLRLRPGLAYLLRYPYGCIEQTSSRLLGLLGFRSALKSGLLPGVDAGESDAMILSGVERILSMQCEDGGFGYWPGAKKTHAEGTLYALSALSLARESGMEVDAAAMEGALAWLGKNLLNSRTSMSRTMALWILAREGKSLLADKHMQKVLRERPTLSLEGQCYLALAHRKLYPEIALTKILSLPVGKERRTYFRPAWRPRALSLMLANAGGHGNPDEIAEDLLKGMSRRGLWTSTADTGWALLALVPHFAGSLSSGFSPGEHRVLDLDLQEILKTGTFSLWDPLQKPLYYELEVTHPRGLQTAEAGGGITLQREIRNLNGEPEYRVGDLVEISLSLKLERGQDYPYLAIEDRLPAGLVAINSALATEEVPESETQGQQGIRDLNPSYFEIRDDRVQVFRNRIWSGSWEFRYFARVICEGDFAHPPAMASLMYEPNRRAYSESGRLEVVSP